MNCYNLPFNLESPPKAPHPQFPVAIAERCWGGTLGREKPQ